MSFTSVEFLLFLAIAAGLFKVVPEAWRALFVLAVSYLFYCSTNGLAALALALATLFTYQAALWGEQARGRLSRKAIMAAAVVLLSGYLIFFKIALLTPKQGFGGLIMPLGISYYSFKLISYVLDVYWGKMPAEKRLVPFAAYVSFFPQIVAGPIERSGDFLTQISGVGSIRRALPRIAWGLTKKLVIADHLAPAVNFVFGHATSLHGAWWIGLYLWPLQLYADFSGLTDIAIGAGRLFGIEGPENFNRPFTAASISDYWRRWHISLTTWLGDYVFMPLRMATRKAGTAGLLFSITVNMIAIGLWHGFTFGYLVFGVLHSVFLSVDALTTRWRKNWFKRHAQWNAAGDWLGWLLTFHLVCMALVFFRARTVPDAIFLLRHAWSGLTDIPAGLLQLPPQTLQALGLGLAGYVVLELCERFRPDKWLRHIVADGPRFLQWAVYATGTLLFAVGFILLLASGSGSQNPFVYAVF